MFRDAELEFGQSALAEELVEAEMDDDVQSDSETVNSAKLGLDFDLRDAIKDFCGARKQVIKNLE